MNKLLPCFMLLAMLLQGCEKEDISGNYPTTIHRLSAEKLALLRGNFITRNPYITSSLNDFGYCDVTGDPPETETPPSSGEITMSAAVDSIKEFVSGNMVETGVTHPEELSFTQYSNDKGYGGIDLWHFRSANQYLDTIEVLNTGMIFHLTNGVVTSCYGNWYSDITVPHSFTLTPTEAKATLVETVVSHYTIAGVEYFVTITKGDLDNSTVQLKILPVDHDDTIELHVCWEINIPGPVFYIIYIDVMTGVVIEQLPTIIS